MSVHLCFFVPAAADGREGKGCETGNWITWAIAEEIKRGASSQVSRWWCVCVWGGGNKNKGDRKPYLDGGLAGQALCLELLLASLHCLGMSLIGTVLLLALVHDVGVAVCLRLHQLQPLQVLLLGRLGSHRQLLQPAAETQSMSERCCCLDVEHFQLGESE